MNYRGFSSKSISEKLGVSASTIERRMGEMKIKKTLLDNSTAERALTTGMKASIRALAAIYREHKKGDLQCQLEE